jgi:hypothetical protein
MIVRMYIHQLIVRSVTIDCRSPFTARWLRDSIITIAEMDGIRNSLSKMTFTIRYVEAPLTFLMLISFILCSIMKSTQQINPKLTIKKDNTVPHLRTILSRSSLQ